MSTDPHTVIRHHAQTVLHYVSLLLSTLDDLTNPAPSPDAAARWAALEGAMTALRSAVGTLPESQRAQESANLHDVDRLLLSVWRASSLLANRLIAFLCEGEEGEGKVRRGKYARMRILAELSPLLTTFGASSRYFASTADTAVIDALRGVCDVPRIPSEPSGALGICAGQTVNVAAGVERVLNPAVKWEAVQWTSAVDSLRAALTSNVSASVSTPTTVDVRHVASAAATRLSERAGRTLFAAAVTRTAEGCQVVAESIEKLQAVAGTVPKRRFLSLPPSAAPLAAALDGLYVEQSSDIVHRTQPDVVESPTNPTTWKERVQREIIGPLQSVTDAVNFEGKSFECRETDSVVRILQAICATPITKEGLGGLSREFVEALYFSRDRRGEKRRREPWSLPTNASELPGQCTLERLAMQYFPTTS